MKRLSEAAVEELHTLVHDGLLTPAAVLTRAADNGSALHHLFTWDDTKAAQLRRLDEARGVIMAVRVHMITQPNTPPVRVRAFVSLADDRVTGAGYREIFTVLANSSQREQLLSTALQELTSLQKKYGHLSELANVFEAVGRLAS